MNKTKIISIVLGIVFICLAANIVNAIKLNGKIDVKIDGYAIGAVTPVINIEENQTISIDAQLVDGVYEVANQDITVNLNIIDNTGRDTFFFPRNLMFGAIAMRNFADCITLKGGLLKKLFPIKSFMNFVPVVNSTLGNTSSIPSSITIALNYTLPSNNTFDNGEELALHLYVMGILPRDIDGISEDIPFFQHKVIKLKIDYY